MLIGLLDMTVSAHRNFRLRKRVACFPQSIGPTVAIRKIGPQDGPSPETCAKYLKFEKVMQVP